MRRLEVGIVGLGLVGGSLARALRAAGHRVVGVDRPHVRRKARRAGAVSASASRVEALLECDVLVLATPPRISRSILRSLRHVIPPRLVVTDVGSVKGPIVRDARRLGLRTFVGGHPMAGTERQGFVASRASLFRGAAWWIVPAPDPRATRLVRAVARSVGARPVTIEAEAHDRVVAFLSHAPQVAAWAILDAARADPVARRHLRAAGPGFRDMTRLAKSPRPLWGEILDENRREVTRALASLARGLERRRRG